MSEEQFQTFEDPKLRAALQRALPAEAAPEALRRKVQSLFEQASVEQPSLRIGHSSESIFFSRWIRPLAMAAMVLICVGTVAWFYELSRPNEHPLPDAFAAALVATHDYCASLPDHHVLKGVPDNDFRLMTQKLREQLGFPALAAAAGDGWTFYGASAMCKVGPASSAHLVFKRSGQSLSLFSVAVASETWPDGKPPADGARFSNMQNGHPIVSWVQDSTVYSVVGASSDQSLDAKTIAPIAEQMRVAISEAVRDSERTTLALGS
jgi:hypothetical protein